MTDPSSKPTDSIRYSLRVDQHAIRCDQWRPKIDQFRHLVERTRGTATQDVCEAFENANQLWDTYCDELDRLRAAGAEAGDELLESCDVVWELFKAAFDRTKVLLK